MRIFGIQSSVVTGSYRDTLTNLVAKQKSPFYKQLLLRQVNPFDRVEYQDFLSQYLPKLRFKDEEVKKELYNITSGNLYNLHLLGKEIKREELNTIDKEGSDRVSFFCSKRRRVL